MTPLVSLFEKQFETNPPYENCGEHYEDKAFFREKIEKRHQMTKDALKRRMINKVFAVEY